MERMFGISPVGALLARDVSDAQGFALNVDTLPESVITGTGGNDTLIGSAQKDTIDGGLGADKMKGLGGADTYIVDNAGDVVVEARHGGNDTVLSSVSYTLGDNVENLTLTGNGLTGTGNALDNVITGNDSHNFLYGRGGDDTLTGGIYVDVMEGGSGNDLLIGGGDEDDMRGGGGDDVLMAAAGQLQGGSGNDLLVMQFSSLGSGLHGDDGNDTLLGGSGRDFALDGGAGDDWIDGRDGDDGLQAGDGNDVLLGGAGEDFLGGGAGNDTLIGGDASLDELHAGDGNDILSGGGGRDALFGEAGSDTFNFDNWGGIVMDFQSGVDRINIDPVAHAIGNGDDVVDGATTIAGPGGFSPTSELVIVSAVLTGDPGAAEAAAAIGSASGAYALGDTAIFVVHTANTSTVFEFTSADHNATVGASELSLVTTLFGTPASGTVAADYSFTDLMLPQSESSSASGEHLNAALQTHALMGGASTLSHDLFGF